MVVITKLINISPDVDFLRACNLFSCFGRILTVLDAKL